MPLKLQGGCRCGAVKFTVDSHTPHPFMLCYCTICRKTGGGGGFGINIMGTAKSLKVRGKAQVAVYRAKVHSGDGRSKTSSARRHACAKCASTLWIFDPTWPELVHPYASAIDTDLPVPPSKVHIMLDDKASWVVPQFGRGDQKFAGYPEESIEDWHKKRKLWVE